ncbi:hypothetical protein NOVOSPHI9U_60194 [Novosphingobium sp. 9U]|nr:hypothetical protein NOVOSPHI9U_60194 [Novosphingobium sp. 9U]
MPMISSPLMLTGRDLVPADRREVMQAALRRRPLRPDLRFRQPDKDDSRGYGVDDARERSPAGERGGLPLSRAVGAGAGLGQALARRSLGKLRAIQRDPPEARQLRARTAYRHRDCLRHRFRHSEPR